MLAPLFEACSDLASESAKRRQVMARARRPVKMLSLPWAAVQSGRGWRRGKTASCRPWLLEIGVKVGGVIRGMQTKGRRLVKQKRTGIQGNQGTGE